MTTHDNTPPNDNKHDIPPEEPNTESTSNLSPSEAAIATAFAIRSYLSAIEDQTSTALMNLKIVNESVVMRGKYLSCIAQGFTESQALFFCMQKWRIEE